MTAAADSAPYLTLVFTGRNDDFGGDFNNRFFRALRFNHEKLSLAGVSHEFVFVEWRPIEGEPYLATLLGDMFGDLTSSQLRSFVVDPRYHDALSLNPRIQFQEFIAKNVGTRRALGQFVLTTNTDIYLGRGVVEYLADHSLAERTLYRAARHDLRDEHASRLLDWNDLHDPQNWDEVNAIKPPYYTNASGDFLLLDRATYGELRGFNEVYRNAKIHMDGNFCVKAHSSGVPLVDLASPVFHVGRGTLHAQRDAFKDRPADAPWGNIRWNSEVVYVNGPEWGLGSAPERRLDDRRTYLEFDWNAVGPMVQLKRIVSTSALRNVDSAGRP